MSPNATYYAQVGTTWGAGDGSTTVNLPDLRGRSIIGAGAGAGLTSRALASNGGAETALADLQSHTHTANVSDPGHVHNMAMDFGSQGTGDGRTVKIGLQDDPTYESIVMAAAATGVTVSNSPTGSGGGHANMQPFAAANHVVKIQ